MDQAKIIELIRKPPTEEILTEKKLQEYLEQGRKLKHYIGFEVSGFVHLGTGIVSMQKVADFQQAGIETTIFLADYHSWINKKLGGDLETIKRVAGGYFKEALKLSLKCVGGDTEKVKFVLGSELYEKEGLKYFENVLKVSMEMSLSRAKRSVTIMGRKMGEEVNFAQLVYVPMQVADIFTMNITLAHGGMDQRKAHVIALEAWKPFGYEPIAIHHHLISGIQITEEQRNKLLEAKRSGNREALEEGIIETKMSKSKPNSAIFIHDTEQEIKEKIIKSFCPAKETELNPIIDLTKFVVWPYLQRNKLNFEIQNQKTKERKVYENLESFENDYVKGLIHPLDLKNAVAEYIIKILEPARKHFLEGAGKKYLEEMKEIKITR